MQGPVAWTDKVVHVTALRRPRRWLGLLAGVRPAYLLVALLALHAPVSELVQHACCRTGPATSGTRSRTSSGVVVGVTLGVVGRTRARW